MSEVRVPHALGRDALKSRLAALAQRHGVALTLDPDGYGGELAKAIPFLGNVRGRFTIEEAALAVRVLEAPAFMSPSSIEKRLREELERLVA